MTSTSLTSTDAARPRLLLRAGAEGMGTFVLVLAGCGAALVDARFGNLGAVGVSLTFGLALFTMVSATGHLSGGHLNPAVSVAFLAGRHLSPREAAAYIAAQILGALGAALALRAFLGPDLAAAATVPAIELPAAFGVEVLMTATLVFVITAVATDQRAEGQHGALAIGATLALGALWGGALTGASMNPARSFGPALVGGIWNQHLLYWFGPLLGATVGHFAYRWTAGARRAARPVPEPHR
ncbi:MAG: aquaporin [Acidobacteriota bacterium]